MKLYLEPIYNKDNNANGGILRVLEAQHKYLPEFGIEIVTDPMEADVQAAHVIGTPKNPNIPFVLQNHGLMWREYHFGEWAENVNGQIVDSMRQADVITAPSEWVKYAISRGIYHDIRVVYHGVDVDEWQPVGEHSNYVLWNKLRSDEVSNPDDMQKLAALMPDVQFVTTIGEETANVKVIGVQDYASMKKYIQHAGLYLATARETFGIGTLEAMACGVPIVGWGYGGQKEIIQQGETGYLAAYGDYKALAEMVYRGLENRKRLGEACRADTERRWQWKDKIDQYAALYYEAADRFHTPRPKVSVIIPCHNLGRFLPDSINSVLKQSISDWECIVVNDASTDETETIAQQAVEHDKRIQYYRTPSNLKLSGTRNFGFAKASGKYICYLDADDMLTPDALALQSNALDTDRSIHIAYGKLDLISENLGERKPNEFPRTFNWFGQMAHHNQVPTGAMMRREVIERSGGWRTRQWRAEDAEFWSRATSFGFQAERVTEQVTLVYRIREDSKGHQEWMTYPDRDGNWLANIAWRSANTAQEGAEYLSRYPNKVPLSYLVPFGAQGTPPNGMAWSVSHRQEPLVTVVIDPSGKHTADELTDTLDSLMGQDMDAWNYRMMNEEPSVADGQYIVVAKVGEMLHNTALREVLEQHMDNPLYYAWLQAHQPIIEATNGSKVLMEYTGLKRGTQNFPVNGRTYIGQMGAKVWVEREDAQVLENRQWSVINSLHPIPLPAQADTRQ